MPLTLCNYNYTTRYIIILIAHIMRQKNITQKKRNQYASQRVLIFIRAPNKPGYVKAKNFSDHLSNPVLAHRDERLTRKSAGSLNLPYSTLLRVGFAKRMDSPMPGELLPRRFILTDLISGFLFCGTFPEFALAGISPALCPAEPGLSSRVLRHRRSALILPRVIIA